MRESFQLVGLHVKTVGICQSQKIMKNTERGGGKEKSSIHMCFQNSPVGSACLRQCFMSRDAGSCSFLADG